MMAPLANNEHPEIQFELAAAIKSALGTAREKLLGMLEAPDPAALDKLQAEVTKATKAVDAGLAGTVLAFGFACTRPRRKRKRAASLSRKGSPAPPSP